MKVWAAIATVPTVEDRGEATMNYKEPGPGEAAGEEGKAEELITYSSFLKY
uniref:Uncharacterized protein n=1 Tax=Amphimedon queenslandica TaxID=400682 RepID=A0A1X7U4S8_AMPQE